MLMFDLGWGFCLFVGVLFTLAVCGLLFGFDTSWVWFVRGVAGVWLLLG